MVSFNLSVWRPLAALLALTIPNVVAQPVIAARATPPASDSFYDPPAGYASKAPGTILKSREIVASFFGLIPEAVAAHQLLYRTTAINGTAIAEVTTVFKPVGASLDRFISFQTAYDSSNVFCDPSYNYEEGAQQTDVISAVEYLFLQSYLAKGYIVASSDYEGPDAAFSAGRLAGMGVLDGMRAVSKYSGLGFTTSTPAIVGAGYSGGAIATSWAASLQSSYAPELPIKGWTSGGTPANLTGTLVYVDDTLFSGFLPAAIDGLAKPSAYGAQLNPLIASVITAFGEEHLVYSDTYCAVEDIMDFSEQSVLATTFQSMGYDFLYDPTFVAVIDQTLLGKYANETPTVPILLYHAIPDEIIPYANASALYETWCDQGASVQFTSYGNGGHFTTEILGVAPAVEFAGDAFAGTLATGCSAKTVLNNTLDPLALGVDLEPIFVGLINQLAHLGEKDSNVLANLTLLSTSAAT